MFPFGEALIANIALYVVVLLLIIIPIHHYIGKKVVSLYSLIFRPITKRLAARKLKKQRAKASKKAEKDRIKAHKSNQKNISLQSNTKVYGQPIKTNTVVQGKSTPLTASNIALNKRR